MKKIQFEYLEEARQNAGFFVREICEELGVSERSYYRWKRAGYAPMWTLKAVRILSGQLDFFGWHGWYLERGVLYSRLHSPKSYNWTQEKLLVDRFWELNKTTAQAAWRTQRPRTAQKQPLVPLLPCGQPQGALNAVDHTARAHTPLPAAASHLIKK